MGRLEAAIRAHQPKQSAGAPRAHGLQAPAQAGRCPGATAQLAAVHRTLRQGPVLQLRAEGAAAGAQPASAPRAAPANRTGLPDRLKAGVEALSGVSLDEVKVHYNSSKPAQLNALAYAQGSDIHLAPGQERHLPHEAWHIVQQAQGRVKPTLQLRGGARINDEAGLEREADIMGARAALSAAPVVGLPAPRVAADGVVQRMVGFEFETGWLVDKNGAPLAKKDPVGTGAQDGFTVEADEAEGGQSEIEFVVEPVEEGMEGFERLAEVMIGVQSYGLKLEARKNGPFTLDKATGAAGDAAFGITPRGPLEAGPQVTSGLSLGKIGTLHDLNGAGGARQAPVELRPSLGGLQDRAREVSGAHGGISPELQGLVAIIGNYLRGGADTKKGDPNLTPELRHAFALNYPKRIADVVLARTDFAKLFKMLPANDQQRFIDDPASWVGFVLATLDADDMVAAGDSVIERGVRVDEDDPVKGLAKPGPKVGEWLLGIVPDQVTGLSADQLKGGAFESMGAMDAKTEAVGPANQRAQAGIFEFRGAQAGKIPLGRWIGFALEFQRYITMVHE